MLARVARYQVEPDRCDDAVRAFEEAAGELGQLQGSVGGYILVDSENGTTMTVTLWEDQRALDASETHAATLRQRAARAADGEVQAVWVFDVVREIASAR